MTLLFCYIRFGAPLFDKGVWHLESTEGSTENGSRSGDIILTYPRLFTVEKVKGKLQIYKELL